MTDSPDPIPRITAADPAAGSGDVVAGNIVALARLFPAVLADGKVDFDVLRQLLGDAMEDGEERYGLTWKGKRRARAFALTPSLGTLRPAKEDSVDWETTRNILVEGENLEVLKLLRKSYSGQVKLIYIDPPYNTGKNFVYSDDYHQSIVNYERITGQRDAEGLNLTSNSELGGRFHTNWLKMMYPRLIAASDLLHEEGVILLSIDDAEFANLRSILDEILGEENFIATLVWEKGRKNDAKLFSKGHEYVIAYARSLSKLRQGGVIWREQKPGTGEIWAKYVELKSVHSSDLTAIESDLQAWFVDLPRDHPSKKWQRYKRVDKWGPWRDRDISWPGGGGPRYDVPHPRTRLPCAVPESGWRYASADEMQRQIRLGTVEFRETHEEPPFRKAHLRPIVSELAEADEIDDSEEDAEGEDVELATQVRGTYFYKQSQVSIKQNKALMGAKIFNNPKDQAEISRLIDYVCDKEAIVMDFFAGSGTTAHATLAQNASDGGDRRFIAVQLPEVLDVDKKEQKAAANFCDQIGKPRTIAELTKERLRRAGAKLRAEHPNTDLDTGFRVYKLATSNLKPWQPDPDDLQASLLEAINNVLPGRTEDDLLVELLLKTGIDLSLPSEARSIAGATVHTLGGGVLMVCLADITEDQAENLGQGICDWRAELNPPRATTFYFKDAGFQNAATKANLAAIIRQRVDKGVEKLASI